MSSCSPLRKSRLDGTGACRCASWAVAGLIVIDSEDFWDRYGGQIKANWESSALRQYSSLDSDSLTELAHDATWSNEGLFALLQGLRRLRQIGGNRVNVPTIEWQ
jgi:hypothetical protein